MVVVKYSISRCGILNNMKKIIKIKGTNIDLTDQIKSYINSQINSLDKFIDATEEDEALFEIEVSKTTTNQNTGKIFRTEINLTIHGQLYRAESTEKELNTSTDVASAEIERQLRRGKNKRIDLFRRGAKKIKNILKWRSKS